jgi:hypothetical protein
MRDALAESFMFFESPFLPRDEIIAVTMNYRANSQEENTALFKAKG